MPETPYLRLAVDNADEQDRDFDRTFELLDHIKAVAPDPDGEHIWFLLEPTFTTTPTC